MGKGGIVLATGFTDEQQQNYNILENTRRLLIPIVAGTMLQYKSIVVQQQMLLDSVFCAETFSQDNYPSPDWIRIIASMFVLMSLLKLQVQNQSIAQQLAAQGQPDACVEPTLTNAIIAISIIRLIRLFQRMEESSGQNAILSQSTSPETQTEPTTQTASQTETAIDTEENELMAQPLP